MLEGKGLFKVSRIIRGRFPIKPGLNISDREFIWLTPYPKGVQAELFGASVVAQHKKKPLPGAAGIPYKCLFISTSNPALC